MSFNPAATTPFRHCLHVSEAAEYLGLHPRTLDNWRSQGCGPRYVRVGRRIVYRVADLETYIESRTVEPSQ